MLRTAGPLDASADADDSGQVQHVAGTFKQLRDHAEREVIVTTPERRGGNISQSALQLGVRRPYLHRRMAALGISKRDYFS